MSSKRIKKASKLGANYSRDFNLSSNLRVLVDIGFAKKTSILKLDVIEKINSMLNINCELYTTSCLLKECELIGHILQKTHDVMNTFNLIKCNHKYNPKIGAVKCVSRYLQLWSGAATADNVKTEDRHHLGEIRFWSLATTDKELITIGKNTVGLPLFFLSYSCIQLLSYGKASENYLKKKQLDILNNVVSIWLYLLDLSCIQY